MEWVFQVSHRWLPDHLCSGVDFVGGHLYNEDGSRRVIVRGSRCYSAASNRSGDIKASIPSSAKQRWARIEAMSWACRRGCGLARYRRVDRTLRYGLHRVSAYSGCCAATCWTLTAAKAILRQALQRAQEEPQDDFCWFR